MSRRPSPDPERSARAPGSYANPDYRGNRSESFPPTFIPRPASQQGHRSFSGAQQSPHHQAPPQHPQLSHQHLQPHHQSQYLSYPASAPPSAHLSHHHNPPHQSLPPSGQHSPYLPPSHLAPLSAQQRPTGAYPSHPSQHQRQHQHQQHPQQQHQQQQQHHYQQSQPQPPPSAPLPHRPHHPSSQFPYSYRPVHYYVTPPASGIPPPGYGSHTAPPPVPHSPVNSYYPGEVYDARYDPPSGLPGPSRPTGIPTGPGLLPVSATASSSSTSGGKKARSKQREARAKPHVPSACTNCRKAHLSCSKFRPCARCEANGRADSCVDVEHKKRGRPRLKDRDPAARPGTNRQARTDSDGPTTSATSTTRSGTNTSSQKASTTSSSTRLTGPTGSAGQVISPIERSNLSHHPPMYPNYPPGPPPPPSYSPYSPTYPSQPHPSSAPMSGQHLYPPSHPSQSVDYGGQSSPHMGSGHAGPSQPQYRGPESYSQIPPPDRDRRYAGSRPHASTPPLPSLFPSSNSHRLPHPAPTKLPPLSGRQSPAAYSHSPYLPPIAPPPPQPIAVAASRSQTPVLAPLSAHTPTRMSRTSTADGPFDTGMPGRPLSPSFHAVPSSRRYSPRIGRNDQAAGLARSSSFQMMEGEVSGDGGYSDIEGPPVGRSEGEGDADVSASATTSTAVSASASVLSALNLSVPPGSSYTSQSGRESGSSALRINTSATPILTGPSSGPSTSNVNYGASSAVESSVLTDDPEVGGDDNEAELRRRKKRRTMDIADMLH